MNFVNPTQLSFVRITAVSFLPRLDLLCDNTKFECNFFGELSRNIGSGKYVYKCFFQPFSTAEGPRLSLAVIIKLE